MSREHADRMANYHAGFALMSAAALTSFTASFLIGALSWQQYAALSVMLLGLWTFVAPLMVILYVRRVTGDE